MYTFIPTSKGALLETCENDNINTTNTNKAGKFEYGAGRLASITKKNNSNLKNKVKENNDYFLRNSFKQKIKIITNRTWESKLKPGTSTKVFPRDFHEQVIRTTFIIFI